MDDINVEDFINEIEIRPAIWNSKSDKHSNRTETKNAWEGICEKFIEDFKNKTTVKKTQQVTFYLNHILLFCHDNCPSLTKYSANLSRTDIAVKFCSF